MVSGRGQIRAPITPLNHPIAAYIFFFLSSSSSLPTSPHSYLLLNSSNKQELIQKTKTTHAEFWYYLVYNRLPDGYTGVNGFTKEEEDSFSVYEFLKKQEHAKLREAAAPREASALHEPAAHPALADEEKQG